MVKGNRSGFGSDRRREEGPLSDFVYERLRTGIIQGEIRPNQRLVEAEVARQLRVSRTPVREGLQRLANEGLVTGGRDGWQVQEHTAGEIREIYETRAALEGYASRLAAERASEENLEELSRIHARAGTGTEITRAQLVELNSEFHDAIVQTCANERLINVIQRNREFYFNYRVAELFTDEEVESSVRGHGMILGRLLERDVAGAEELTRQHILESVPIILSRLRPPQGPPNLSREPVEGP